MSSRRRCVLLKKTPARHLTSVAAAAAVGVDGNKNKQTRLDGSRLEKKPFRAYDTGGRGDARVLGVEKQTLLKLLLLLWRWRRRARVWFDQS